MYINYAKNIAYTLFILILKYLFRYIIIYLIYYININFKIIRFTFFMKFWHTILNYNPRNILIGLYNIIKLI